MKYKVIIDPSIEEEIIIKVHKKTPLVEQIEKLINSE